MWKKILKHFKHKINQKTLKKALFFSGHDGNIVAAL